MHGQSTQKAIYSVNSYFYQNSCGILKKTTTEKPKSNIWKSGLCLYHLIFQPVSPEKHIEQKTLPRCIKPEADPPQSFL